MLVSGALAAETVAALDGPAAGWLERNRGLHTTFCAGHVEGFAAFSATVSTAVAATKVVFTWWSACLEAVAALDRAVAGWLERHGGGHATFVAVHVEHFAFLARWTAVAEALVAKDWFLAGWLELDLGFHATFVAFHVEFVLPGFVATEAWAAKHFAVAAWFEGDAGFFSALVAGHVEGFFPFAVAASVSTTVSTAVAATWAVALEAVTALDRAASVWLERYLGLYSTLCTLDVEHFSRSPISIHMIHFHEPRALFRTRNR